MGCDIHAVFQARKDGLWQDVPSTWDQDRHYFLFSWLANVRNGYGFAGTPTYDPIRPISEPRGLPADFTGGEEHPTAIEALAPFRQKYAREDAERGEAVMAYMGDHSFSWLNADEILAAERPKTRRTGVITRVEYEKWDGKQPESWSGGISGAGIVVSFPGEIRPETTHVQVSWISIDDELDYFVDEVRRLKKLHGDVRIVFGFDS